MNAKNNRWSMIVASGPIGTVVGALTVLASMTWAGAATPVSNLVLRPNGAFTELSVVGGGRMLCDHFSQEPGNGHPFRVVLDFCDADHALGQQNFESLPASVITRIRTSQYATSPQQIVRVVLDMREPVTYTLSTTGNDVTVRMVDPQHSSFSVWEANASARPVLAGPAEPAKSGKEMASTEVPHVSTSGNAAKNINPRVPANPKPEAVTVATVPAPSQPSAPAKLKEPTVPSTVKTTSVMTPPQAPAKRVESEAKTATPVKAATQPATPTPPVVAEQSSKPVSRPSPDTPVHVAAVSPAKTGAPVPVAPPRIGAVASNPSMATASKPADQSHAKIDEATSERPTLTMDPPPVIATEIPLAGSKPAAVSPVPTPSAAASARKPFIPPVKPLVLVTEYLIGDASTATPTESETDKVPIAKVSMQPIGPQPSVPSSAGSPTAEAPQTPSPMLASIALPSGSSGGASTNKSASATGQESLFERLKAKFLTDQTPPRPYTTVEDNSPVLEADSLTPKVYGPPSPALTLDRQALLERIRLAGQAGSTETEKTGEEAPTTGAAGIPARSVVFYDDMGRRDPFAPLVKGQRSGFLTEQLPSVENLRLVGVLRDDRESMALLENMEGYGYVMRAGDRVENGAVMAIQENRVLFRVEDYGWSHVVALQLTTRGTDPSKSLGANTTTPYQKEYQTPPQTEEQKPKTNETPKTESVNP